MLWEPAIATELGHLGRYDEAAFVSLVRQKAFGFFVSEGEREELREPRYSSAVALAVAQAYPIKRHAGRYVVHLPAD